VARRREQRDPLREQRAQAKKNYDELIATAGFPDKPDGSKFVYRAAVKTGR
jgi:multiple sugar transport system substrate-binding protein